MQTLKILVVEDDTILAYQLSKILVDIGYLVTDKATDFDSAIYAFKKNLPDLVMIDIDLGEKSKDGIELAKYLNALGQNIPLIFISGNYGEAFRERAYETAHADFLVKPYNKYQIELSVERALRSFDQPTNKSEVLTGSHHVFIKNKTTYVRINTADILAVVADRGLSYIYTIQKKHTVSTHLNDLLQQLNDDQLIRIHRSHVVNLNMVLELNFGDGQITVGTADEKMILNVGPKYKEEFINRLKTIRSSS